MSSRACFTIVLITSILTATTSYADDSSEAFDPWTIIDVRLDIPASSWSTIDDEALSGCVAIHRDYQRGTVTIEGMEFPGSGIRAKGGRGSSRTLDGNRARPGHLRAGRTR